MKIVSLLSLLAVCACATPTQRGVAAHIRHERNSIQAEPAARDVAPAPEPADLPRRVIFARTLLQGWRIEAMTDVDDAGGLPVIAQTLCEIERGGIQLVTWGETGLWLRFGDGSAEPDLDLRSANIRRIEIDDEVWEYRWVPTDENDRHFLNLAYAPPIPCPGCLSAAGGWKGVRRGPGHPWLGPNQLSNALLGARTLRLGFQDRDDDERLTGPMLWVEIPLSGLVPAIAWCRERLASEAAARFHGGLERE